MPSPSYWQTSRYRLRLDERPLVMGIVNNTPDSFSDGGQHCGTASALAHAEQLLKQGADILDIGGESTRPGSPPVLLEEELERVLPLVRECSSWGVALSVDTNKPQVMQAALDAGADIINDVWALRRAGALEAVAGHPSCGICLMHMHNTPLDMQIEPLQGDPVAPVMELLNAQTESLIQLGVQSERIAWDYGIGFGKTVEQNFRLLARQSAFLESGFPLLVGWSRKSSLGAVTGLSVEDRLVPSTVAAVLAVQGGASIVRVHDVAQTRAALSVWQAVKDAEDAEDAKGE